MRELLKKTSMKGINIILIASSITIIDQIFKYKVHQYGGLYICNYGISLGLPLNISFYWLIIAILLFFLIKYHKHIFKICTFNFVTGIATGLLIGGILSNAIDRLHFKCVIDYIFPIWQILPVFNIADIAIFIGAALIFFNTHSNNIKKS